MIVAAFALLTVMSGLAAAQADVITVNHLAHGERLLADGAWSSACDTAVPCQSQAQHTGALSLHHHHHSSCKFGALPSCHGAGLPVRPPARATWPAYAAVAKPAAPSAADQPPKA